MVVAMNPLLSALLGPIMDVVGKLIPDPQAKAQAQLEVMRMAQAGELAQLDAATKLALAQVAVNQADAQGASTMQRNWRPFIGWVCGVALAWDTIGRPMATMAWVMAGHLAPVLPTLSNEQLYTTLFGLLGLGGLRTIEKTKGAA